MSLGEIGIRLPSAAEQREIADLLDFETARIDSLIAQECRLVQLLSERRQSLLTAALEGRLADAV